MKQGIHLGPPLRSGPSFVGAVLLVALAATFLHGAAWVRARLDVESRREAIERRRELLGQEATRLDVDARAMSQLAAALDLGAAELTPATELLDEIASRLPSSVTLTSIGLSGDALVLEGVANDPASVSELQRDMSASPLVAGTRLLEERRAPSGRLAVRLRLDLAGERGR